MLKGQAKKDYQQDFVYGVMQSEDDGTNTTFKCPDCGTAFAVIADAGFASFRFEYPIICCGKVRCH